MSSYEQCGYYSDGECNICGMGMSGEDTFCRLCKDNPNCYYKQLSELKAENERLKEEIKEVKKYQYQQEYFDKEIEEMQKALKTLAEGLNIRQQTLQEIKEIADAKCNECKYGKDGISCKYGDCGEAKLHLIVQLINKVEEE